MVIQLEIILKNIPATEAEQKHCAMSLDIDDPLLFEKIQDHINIFKSLLNS